MLGLRVWVLGFKIFNKWRGAEVSRASKLQFQLDELWVEELQLPSAIPLQGQTSLLVPAPSKVYLQVVDLRLLLGRVWAVSQNTFNFGLSVLLGDWRPAGLRVCTHRPISNEDHGIPDHHGCFIDLNLRGDLGV